MQNKYDTSVTMKENSSLTYMLKNIKPGSTVLEFGPATGYMTRYLKEQMNCQVYIVEIDSDAYEKASVYAEDGICGNAEDIQWYEKFKNIRFDYITFADVLEHLVNPWQVLKYTAELLKTDTGKVLVSIPNIGHNAVLVDLINNKFEYRRTGIMDNTHLRFFTHDSVVKMFRECGLYVENEDAVVFNLEYVGFGNSESDVSENIWRELQLRKYGFVNQFLFTLGMNEVAASCETDTKTAITYECALYYATDDTFCEEQKVLGNVQMTGNHFCAKFEIDEEIEMKLMIVELFPFSGVISGMEIETEAVVDEICPINGMIDGTEYCFWGNDIRIQIRCKEVQKPRQIRISGTLSAMQTRRLGDYIVQLMQQHEEVLVQRDLENQRLNEVVKEKVQIVHQLGQTIQEKEQRLSEQSQRLSEQEQRLSEQKHQLTMKDKIIAEKEAFIAKVKDTSWFRVFGKHIMKDK